MILVKWILEHWLEILLAALITIIVFIFSGCAQIILEVPVIHDGKVITMSNGEAVMLKIKVNTLFKDYELDSFKSTSQTLGAVYGPIGLKTDKVD